MILEIKSFFKKDSLQTIHFYSLKWVLHLKFTLWFDYTVQNLVSKGAIQKVAKSGLASFWMAFLQSSSHEWNRVQNLVSKWAIQKVSKSGLASFWIAFCKVPHMSGIGLSTWPPTKQCRADACPKAQGCFRKCSKPDWICTTLYHRLAVSWEKIIGWELTSVSSKMLPRLACVRKSIFT